MPEVPETAPLSGFLKSFLTMKTHLRIKASQTLLLSCYGMEHFCLKLQVYKEMNFEVSP